MKITNITTYRLPPRWMFLKIETDEGIVGWGEPVIEGRARTVEAAVHEFGDYLIGQDPARINDLWQVMYRGGFYRGGPIMMSAIAGIDQALWDIKGKVLNAPVWQLMGGLVRDKIKAYSWVGGDRPAEVIDGIKKLRGIGFDTFKLNGCEEMGIIDNSRAVDAAVNTVAQIREAFGNEIEFGLDFHGRVSAPMAKVLIKELEPYRPLFIEEPVLAEQAEYYPRLAAQTHIPIAAGERMFSRFEFKRVLEAGGVAILPVHSLSKAPVCSKYLLRRLRMISFGLLSICLQCSFRGSRIAGGTLICKRFSDASVFIPPPVLLICRGQLQNRKQIANVLFIKWLALRGENTTGIKNI